jgi:rhamnogalacturonyl hydrolase YesR
MFFIAVLKGIELLKSQGKPEATLRQAIETLLDKHLKVSSSCAGKPCHEAGCGYTQRC